MTNDPYSPYAPARIRGLLLPSGKIRSSKFYDYCHHLKSESWLELGNVKPSSRSQRKTAKFSPTTATSGTVFYELSSNLPSASHLALAPFELFREPLLVIGIVDGSEYNHFSSGRNEEAGDKIDIQENQSLLGTITNALTELKEKYPKALLHQLLIFNSERSGSILNLPENVKAICFETTANNLDLKEFMYEVTSLLLDEMASYSKTVQALHAISSPTANSSVDESVSYNGWPTSLTYSVSQVEKTKLADNGNTSTTYSEQRKMLVPLNKTDPATTFEEMTNSLMTSNLAAKQEVERNASNVESKKIPVQGFGSGSRSERARDIGQARTSSIIGQLYLLSGHWPEALDESTKSVTKCKLLDEYLWHAKGLETILICLLLQAWAGHELKIPQVCYPEGTRYSFSKSSRKASGENYSNATAATFEVITLQNFALLLPNLLNMILSLYTQASNSSTEGISQIIFSECIIRFTKILDILNALHGEIGPELLHKLLTGSSNSRSQAKTMKKSSFVPKKDDIARFLFQAMPTDNRMLQVDKIAILSGMEVALSDLQLHRKKAFVTRELVSSMVPALIHARRARAAEMGVHPAADLSALLDDAGDTQLKIEDRDADRDLEEFLRYLTKIYDIPELKVPVEQPLETLSLQRRRAFSLFNSQKSGNLSVKLNVLRLCIAFCEALPNFRGISYFSALLLALCGPCNFSDLSAENSPVNLSREEQIHLATNISRVTGMAHTQGLHEIETDYWDDFLLKDIRLKKAVNSEHFLHFQKSGNIPHVNRQTGNTKNPFIFSNLSKRSEIDVVPHLITGEECEFIVVLQNPYYFETIVEWLEICFRGAKLTSHAENITLSPFKTESFLVKATLEEAGDLVIEGCKIKIYGCQERVFHVLPNEWQSKFELRKTNITIDTSNSSNISKNLSNDTQVSDDNLLSEIKLLRIKVIPEQPTLVVKGLSTPQAALMLLEGESNKVLITLSNISKKIGVNSLAVSCSDSITTFLESMSTDKQALTPEIYEKQYLLQTRPSSKLLRTFDTLLPGQSKGLEVSFTGVVGLTQATVQIYYAHLGEEDSQKEGKFAKRLELPIAITVIPNVQLQQASLLSLPQHFVYESDRLVRSEAEQEFIGNGHGRGLHSTTRHIFDSISNCGSAKHCMIVLDFRNLWSHPLHTFLRLRSNVIAKSTTGSDIRQVVEDVVGPDHVSRFTLIIPQIYVENPYASIPPLQPAKERQFVRKSDLSVPDVDLADLKAFWYREKLLELIEGSWVDHTSGRSGWIDLRRLHMTVEFIELLKLDDIDIKVTILQDAKDNEATINNNDKDDRYNGENDHKENLVPQQQWRQRQKVPQQAKVQRINASKFIVPTDDFLILRTSLYNRSSLPIHSILRLLPSLANHAPHIALDLDGRLAFSGMMQKVLPVLGPGKSLESDLSFCALAKGTYEIGATVEEVRRVQSSQGGDNEDDVSDIAGQGECAKKKAEASGEGLASNSDTDAAMGRRRWHMREMCCIVAV